MNTYRITARTITTDIFDIDAETLEEAEELTEAIRQHVEKLEGVAIDHDNDETIKPAEPTEESAKNRIFALNEI